jgi:hypothetical protein
MSAAGVAPAAAVAAARAAAARAADARAGYARAADADDVTREQLCSEIAHWGYAIAALQDLDAIASASAWAGLEEYLRTGLRSRLLSVVSSLGLEATALETAFRARTPIPVVRDRLLRLRARYLQIETVVDFFGDALATRANAPTAAILRGLDTLASDSMDAALRPLGLESPPALVYFDKGLGASILRAGVRLWDRANPSPAAAIKLTRHNASHPTALFHETGHQVGHLTGWNAELAQALRRTLAPRSIELAEMWEGWASEVAADVYAFTLAGWAPLPALANVVDGLTPYVYRIIPGDPHPSPWIRVMFNAALCRSWYGRGAWDRIAATWAARHPPARAGEGGRLARLSMTALGDIVDVCTRAPMRAFGGRPLTALIDPRRVSPRELASFAQRAGPSMLTSSYLERRESIRILTWLAIRATLDHTRARQHGRQLEEWLARVGRGAVPIAKTA